MRVLAGTLTLARVGIPIRVLAVTPCLVLAIMSIGKTSLALVTAVIRACPALIPVPALRARQI